MSAGELKFSTGEVIEITELVNEEWRSGRIGSREGIFPIVFVKIIKELPKKGILLACADTAILYFTHPPLIPSSSLALLSLPLSLAPSLPSLPPSSAPPKATGTSHLQSSQLSDDLLPKGVALYDFTAGNDEEISFKVYICINCVENSHSVSQYSFVVLHA